MEKTANREWDLFVNPKTGKIEFNEVCRQCLRACKQGYRATLVACPRFMTDRSLESNPNPAKRSD